MQCCILKLVSSSVVKSEPSDIFMDLGNISTFLDIRERNFDKTEFDITRFTCIFYLCFVIQPVTVSLWIIPYRTTNCSQYECFKIENQDVFPHIFSRLEKHLKKFKDKDYDTITFFFVSFKNFKYLHDFIGKQFNDNYPYHLMKKYLHSRSDIKILKSFMIYVLYQK